MLTLGSGICVTFTFYFIHFYLIQLCYSYVLAKNKKRKNVHGNAKRKVIKFGFQKHYIYPHICFPQIMKNITSAVYVLVSPFEKIGMLVHISYFSDITESIMCCPETKYEFKLLSLQILSIHVSFKIIY